MGSRLSTAIIGAGLVLIGCAAGMLATIWLDFSHSVALILAIVGVALIVLGVGVLIGYFRKMGREQRGP